MASSYAVALLFSHRPQLYLQQTLKDYHVLFYLSMTIHESSEAITVQGIWVGRIHLGSVLILCPNSAPGIRSGEVQAKHHPQLQTTTDVVQEGVAPIQNHVLDGEMPNFWPEIERLVGLWAMTGARLALTLLGPSAGCSRDP